MNKKVFIKDIIFLVIILIILTINFNALHNNFSIMNKIYNYEGYGFMFYIILTICITIIEILFISIIFDSIKYTKRWFKGGN